MYCYNIPFNLPSTLRVSPSPYVVQITTTSQIIIRHKRLQINIATLVLCRHPILAPNLGTGGCKGRTTILFNAFLVVFFLQSHNIRHASILVCKKNQKPFFLLHFRKRA